MNNRWNFFVLNVREIEYQSLNINLDGALTAVVVVYVALRLFWVCCHSTYEIVRILHIYAQLVAWR
jgi:hypothetical protein